MENRQGAYDEDYYRYREAHWDFRIEVKLLYELLRPRPDSRILEVGCGGGALLAFLEGRGHTPVGVDILEAAVTAAVKMVDRSEILLGDAYHIPFPDGSFDRIVSHHLVEHLEDLPAALSEWSRVLGPQGVMAICTPNRLYGNPRVFYDPDHVHIYDRPELTEEVSKAGFEVERTMTVFPHLARNKVSVWVGVPTYRLFTLLPYFRDRGRSLLLSAHGD